MTPKSDLSARVKNRWRIKNRFRAARNLSKKVVLFEKAEKLFSESELDEFLLGLCIRSYEDSEYDVETLSYAQRTLKVFGGRGADEEKVVAMPIAIATLVCGFSYWRLRRYGESLDYLNSACSMLYKLRKDMYCFLREDKSIEGKRRLFDLLHDAENGLFHVKNALGKPREEAIAHLVNAVKVVSSSRKDSRHLLYSGYKQVATEYLEIRKYKEALPYCQAALEILMKDPRWKPLEELDCRRILARIQSGLKVEAATLVPPVLSRFGVAFPYLYLPLGSHYWNDAATGTSTATLPQMRRRDEKEDKARMMVSTGEDLCREKKFAEAKKCLETSLKIFLEKKSYDSPALVIASLLKTSEIYEEMKEIESAILVSKRVLKMVKKSPLGQASVGKVSGNIGRLFLYNDQADEALPFLKGAVDWFKRSCCSKVHELAPVYNNLGVAYMVLDRSKLAAQVFENAKDIMDESLGPDHLKSLRVSMKLSNAYAALRSYDEAIKILEKVVDGLKRINAQKDLVEAIEFLEKFKEKKAASGT